MMKVRRFTEAPSEDAVNPHYLGSAPEGTPVALAACRRRSRTSHWICVCEQLVCSQAELRASQEDHRPLPMTPRPGASGGSDFSELTDFRAAVLSVTGTDGGRLRDEGEDGPRGRLCVCARASEREARQRDMGRPSE